MCIASRTHLANHLKATPRASQKFDLDIFIYRPMCIACRTHSANHIRASPIVPQKIMGKSISFTSGYKILGAYLLGFSNNF
jgi:hypothetical protein